MRRLTSHTQPPRAQPRPKRAVVVVAAPIGDPPPLRVSPCREESCEHLGVHPEHPEDFPPAAPDGKPVGKGRRPPGQQLTDEERRARERARKAARRERLKEQMFAKLRRR